ncbi:MAG: hypothetical protein KDM91_22380, partial [Verrucomicrobiae bacterium]|nr:hypothetical protein [Verrucomicrobiae bacterium]
SKSASREAFEELSEALKKAFRAGASDAKKAIDEAVPRTKEDFSKGLHDIAYGLSYLVAFGAEMARQVTPDSVESGIAEGSAAGRDAAEKLKRRREEAKAADVSGTGPEPATA